MVGKELVQKLHELARLDTDRKRIEREMQLITTK